MEAKVELLRARIAAADPRTVLARGYTLVTDNEGVVLKSAAGLNVDDKVRIFFADGKVSAAITEK
jgi:exodeoxyribonuclease VII large subunit